MTAVTRSSPVRIDVSSWVVVADETAGAEVKLWLEDPEGHSWLYKPVVVKKGHRQGEDWAELIASSVAEQLGLPCASTALARLDDLDGSISLDLRPRQSELVPGWIWMLVEHRVPGYIPGRDPQCPRGRPGHSLHNLKLVLDGVLPPPVCSLPDGFSAFDVFAGFLVLDALIANRDRHDENWSVLRPAASDEPVRLCGSYDHASSLGFNLTDSERTDRMAGGRGGVARWVSRGTAWRFEHEPADGPATLVALAAEAVRMASPAAITHWREIVARVRLDQAVELIEDVREMSEPTRTFTRTVLSTNLERMRDEFDRHR